MQYLSKTLSLNIRRVYHDSIQVQGGRTYPTDILLLNREVVCSPLAKHDGYLNGNTFASWWYSWLRIEDHYH